MCLSACDIKKGDNMKSTENGYINKNNQKNLGYAGVSSTHYNQSFFKMQCLDCGYTYFANGCDVWLRKCPRCQVVKYTKVVEEVRQTFKDVPIYTEFTTSEIKDMVYSKFGRNKGSVIPSDYCYNRCNKGIKYEKSLHIFRFVESDRYVYLGENYTYTGYIYHKPKGSNEDIIVGRLEKGVLVNPINFSSDKVDKKEKASSNIVEVSPKKQHRTSRQIGAGLRYQVLKRDNYKCCICGASPAKDPSIELHIDHIIPWSKGGETVIDNLQTLCSRCNLGKSDDV